MVDLKERISERVSQFCFSRPKRFHHLGALRTGLNGETERFKRTIVD